MKNEIKVYICQYCSKEFDSYGKLNGHRTSAHIKPKRKCKYCDKLFLNVICSMHENSCKKKKLGTRSYKKFKCNICGKRYETKTNYIVHQNKCKLTKDRIQEIKDLSKENSIIELKKLGYRKSEIVYVREKHDLSKITRKLINKRISEGLKRNIRKKRINILGYFDKKNKICLECNKVFEITWSGRNRKFC